MFVFILAAAVGLASGADLSVLKPSTSSSVISSNARIIGGTATSIDRYPYTVQLIILSNFLCGGSLLTRRHLLSAAHCFIVDDVNVRPSEISARVGTTLLMSGGNTHSVSTIVRHPSYNVPVMDNDIAVLVLTSQVSFSNFRVISLPAQGWELPDNVTLTHVGWGVTSEVSTQASLILQEVHIRSVNREICRQRYYEASGMPNLITSNMICAGILDVGGKDACQGDSGGPLIYEGALVGVTSFGEGCAHPRYPGVSAKVSTYTNWVTDVVNRYGGNASAHSLSGILLILSLITVLMTAIN